ncbi:MAG: type VI secretion system contractile sheath large subunit [Planctomycetes bacterium]|nr:type VI secretion system contractile sheath large subunit [Planctomycetota bacterium]
MTGKDAIQGFSNSFGFGPSDRPDQRPLPLRMVCVADFRGAGHGEDIGPQAVDAHNIDSVMSRLKPRAFLDIPGPSPGDKPQTVDVTLLSLKDFEPQRVAALVPGLNPLQAFITRARELQAGTLSPADFKHELAAFDSVAALRPILDDLLDLIGGQAPRPAPAPTETEAQPDAVSSAIDSIFSMVDTGPPKTADKAASAMDAAGAAIAGRGHFDLSGPISRAQKLLQGQLAAILQHPQWRALEAAWRGLHFLCRNGKAANIELLHSGKDDLADILHRYVVRPDREGHTAPVSLILCDLPLANTPADVTLVQALGDIGAEVQAPVAIALTAAFLGVENLGALAALDNPAGRFETSDFDQWRSLRDKDAARWLVAAVNGFAARQPFTAARHGYAETPLTEEAVTWLSPVWLVGAAVARSQENTGWPSNHTGLVDGEIPGLAVFDVPGRDSQFPLQAILPEQHIRDLARAGLTPLLAQPNHDSAWLLLAPVLRRVSRAEEEGKMNTLAYALLAARLGASVGMAKARLVAVNDADRTRVNFEQFLDGLLSDTGPGAGSDVRIADGAIHLTLRVGKAVLNGVELRFSLPL